MQAARTANLPDMRGKKSPPRVEVYRKRRLLRRALLILLLVAARTKIGEQIGEVSALQILSERRHQLAAVYDLEAHLVLVQPSAYAGQVRSLVTAGIVNCVAVYASAGGENRCAMRPLGAARGRKAWGRAKQQKSQR
jgi:hypothetical protein